MTAKSIYVVAAEDGPCKIGISNNCTERLESFRTGSPFNLSLAFAREVKDARRVENCAHYLLRSKRIRGEWFRISEAQAVETVTKAIGLIEDGWEKPRPPLKKRGPPKRYGKRVDAYMSTDTLKQLDHLRGKRSRSQAIRDLIRESWIMLTRVSRPAK